MRHWLMKSEPDVYSIEDLEREGTTMWDGVRNYQARNLMRDDMNVGDKILFYHSNTSPPGVAGVATVCSQPYPDPTQFDQDSPYHDPRSDPQDPRWILVDVAHEETFDEIVPLPKLREEERLAGMPLLQKGQRLSVQPVEPEHFEVVLSLASGR